MEIPTTKKLNDAERFCEGLAMLARECNLTSIEYAKIGIYKYEFADGSSIGSIRAHQEAGIVSYL